MDREQTIKEVRLAAGITVAELAIAACVGETTIKRVERGETISAGSIANLEIALKRALAERAQRVDRARLMIPIG
jgi:transcriptional regulator with XRE-family HTH domain